MKRGKQGNPFSCRIGGISSGHEHACIRLPLLSLPNKYKLSGHSLHMRHEVARNTYWEAAIKDSS